MALWTTPPRCLDVFPLPWCRQKIPWHSSHPPLLLDQRWRLVPLYSSKQVLQMQIEQGAHRRWGPDGAADGARMPRRMGPSGWVNLVGPTAVGPCHDPLGRLHDPLGLSTRPRRRSAGCSWKSCADKAVPKGTIFPWFIQAMMHHPSTMIGDAFMWHVWMDIGLEPSYVPWKCLVAII